MTPNYVYVFLLLNVIALWLMAFLYRRPKQYFPPQISHEFLNTGTSTVLTGTDIYKTSYTIDSTSTLTNIYFDLPQNIFYNLNLEIGETIEFDIKNYKTAGAISVSTYTYPGITPAVTPNPWIFHFDDGTISTSPFTLASKNYRFELLISDISATGVIVGEIYVT